MLDRFKSFSDPLPDSDPLINLQKCAIRIFRSCASTVWSEKEWVCSGISIRPTSLARRIFRLHGSVEGDELSFVSGSRPPCRRLPRSSRDFSTVEKHSATRKWRPITGRAPWTSRHSPVHRSDECIKRAGPCIRTKQLSSKIHFWEDSVKNRLTKEEARSFRRRWAAVNRAEEEELKRTPAVEKIRQLAALIASADQMGWSDALSEEEDKVRNRWMRLKEEHRVR